MLRPITGVKTEGLFDKFFGELGREFGGNIIVVQPENQGNNGNSETERDPNKKTCTRPLEIEKEQRQKRKYDCMHRISWNIDDALGKKYKCAGYYETVHNIRIMFDFGCKFLGFPRIVTCDAIWKFFKNAHIARNRGKLTFQFSAIYLCKSCKKASRKGCCIHYSKTNMIRREIVENFRIDDETRKDFRKKFNKIYPDDGYAGDLLA